MENLLKIGQLKEHPADPEEIERLLAAAARSLQDARVREVSPETRFDASYRAVMQVGLAALMSKGYRPNTNRPGHHATTIQALTLTLGVDRERMIVLDALRRKRNLADYTGDDVDDGSVEACIEQAERLLTEARRQLGPKG